MSNAQSEPALPRTGSHAGARTGPAASFGALVRAELGRLTRRAPVVFCTLLLPPLYAVGMGLLFATNLVMPVGGFGFLDSSLVVFPAVLIAVFGLLLTPVDLAARRTDGELRAYATRPGVLLGADLLARLALLLTGIVLAYGIGLFGFGVRPGGGALNGLVTVLAAGLGAAAFVALGQLLAVSLPSARTARVLGHVLLYPLVLVSGAVFPLQLLPAVVGNLAPISPVGYLADLLAGTWLQGAGLQGGGAIGVPALVLAGMCGLAGLLAIRRARTSWS